MKKTVLLLTTLFAVSLFFTAYPQAKREQAIISENFVFIGGGAFMMGSPEDEPNREHPYAYYAGETQHSVTVSSFYMSKYQVTQKEWYDVMGTTLRQKKFKKDEAGPLYGEGDDYPMYLVSWYDAVEYCNKRSLKEGLTPAYDIDKKRRDPDNKSEYDDIKWWVERNPEANGYRLPTEAEWEYACRAGTTTPFNTGNYITTDQANFDGRYPYNNDTKGIYRKSTTPVGSFAPNQWGLYDMHGNVWEWCWDWFDGYANSQSSDPVGPVSGEQRMIRGGSWGSNGQFLRSAYRRSKYSYYRDNLIGFRVVRAVDADNTHAK